ncbi:MAG: uncharacterized protein QG622_366 [Actinomycetota bacterium]|nr:uncharacterized protein [Actinomycetota bacterium]
MTDDPTEATIAPDDDGRDLMEALDPAACARLLAATEFGRLAVVEDGRPRIVVLNHFAEDGYVLFRTRDDVFLARLIGAGAIDVVYEVDGAFPVGRTGWSVIVAGSLVRETDPARIVSARERLATWAEGHRDLVLRLDVQEITGRRVGRG